ncbi:Periplasmic dipeptide transport protein, partial [Geodia barretti]
VLQFQPRRSLRPGGSGRHFRTGHARFQRRHGCARTGGVNAGRGGCGLRDGTLMASDWGTQAFEPRDASGQIMTQHRMLHGWLIAGNENTEMIPGIAEKWELSEDGLQWTWTIRNGVKFHNGDDLTIDDIQFTLDRHHGPEAAENAIHSVFISHSR